MTDGDKRRKFLGRSGRAMKIARTFNAALQRKQADGLLVVDKHTAGVSLFGVDIKDRAAGRLDICQGATRAVDEITSINRSSNCL
jgi:hypothetical protein